MSLLAFACAAAAETNAPAQAVPGAHARGAGVGLSQYRLVRGPLVLETMTDNFSGITYDAEAGRLLGVVNDPPAVFEITPAGGCHKLWDLEGFEDVEDIASTGSNRFVVVEERRRALVRVDADPRSERVNRSACVALNVDPRPAKNSGLEGIGLARGGALYIVKEKNPRHLYRVEGSRVSTPWDAERVPGGVEDLAAVHVDARFGHLLLLSDESRCIVEMTPGGREVDRLQLTAGHAGLSQDIPDPEGLTFTADGRLFVASEPNLLYIFEKGAPE